MNIIYKLIIEIPAKGISYKINKLFINLQKVYLLEIIGPIRLPIKIKKFTVLRSPHVFKKSMEHFQKISNKFFFLINLKSNKKNEFNKILNLLNWSFLNIALKKIKIEKKVIYLKQKDSNL